MLSLKLYGVTFALFLTCAVLLFLSINQEPPARPNYQRLVELGGRPEFDEKRMTRKELGTHGWALLHSTAAYFPARPTEQQLQDVYEYLHYFGEFFPCKECGGHFLQMLDDQPPMFTTREEFMVYMCKLHNIVNQRLEKSLFDCSISNLVDRWGGDADCACDDPA